jgi:signal peptide peptidase SppA
MDDVLAIHEPTWAAMAEVLELQRRGATLTRQEAAARADLTPRVPASASARAIAVLPLFGLLFHRGGGLLAWLFGGTSLPAFTEAVREAATDPNIRTIMLHVDSPGGDVTGTPEAAEAVFAARQRKRVVAAIDGLGASAAYWIAAQAHEVIASPSSQVGSIGVLAVHTDVSRADEAAGLRRTIIASSRFKAEGTPFEPLSKEARAHLQSRVDEAGAMFTAAVARGRGVAVAAVRGPEFGEGRAYFAGDAVGRGLVDRLATLQAAIGAEATRMGDAAAYDRAQAWYLELRARGIQCERPRRPVADEAARLRLRLAEQGL